jgi:hypothetical protein
VNGEIMDRVAVLEKIAAHSALDEATKNTFKKRLQQLNKKLPALADLRIPHDLKRFRGARRRLIQKLVDIVYDATGNEAASKSLVDKILRRLCDAGQLAKSSSGGKYLYLDRVPLPPAES